MPDSENGVHYSIEEWWNSSGHYHEGHPSNDQLIDEARELTVHVWDDEGDDRYFTAHSPDGWYESELNAEVDDFYASDSGKKSK